MDILAQRKSVGMLTGQLLVGGCPATRSFIRKTAYVPQDDNFVPTMTTIETMRFYAAIILPDSMGRAGRLQRVEEVLAAVGLGTHHKTLVGGVLPGGLMLRGLSGGERKRLSIAAGILASPSVVYLDGVCVGRGVLRRSRGEARWGCRFVSLITWAKKRPSPKDTLESPQGAAHKAAVSAHLLAAPWQNRPAASTRLPRLRSWAT
jgi:ATP-binding cassette subfamily G (WHITE) protein 2